MEPYPAGVYRFNTNPVEEKERAKVAEKKRILNARKDTPDIRDRMYEPALIQLRGEKT